MIKDSRDNNEPVSPVEEPQAAKENVNTERRILGVTYDSMPILDPKYKDAPAGHGRTTSMVVPYFVHDPFGIFASVDDPENQDRDAIFRQYFPEPRK